MPQIPSVGFGLVSTRSLNAAGVGSCCLVTGSTGADRSGNRVKRSIAKSSTMKGPTEEVREGLPVRFSMVFATTQSRTAIVTQNHRHR